MQLIFFKFLGRVLAALPESWVRALCCALGSSVGVFMPGRRRATLANLHHAFPEATEAWRRRVFRESCARLVEMALFLPASAYFSNKRLDAVLEIDAATREQISAYTPGGERHGHPLVYFLPHMTLAETATLLPRAIPEFPVTHVVFRPLDQASVNEWVTELRGRFGARLHSRKEGFNEVMAGLRKGEAATILFDQDASKRGTNALFMGRLVSMTELPGLVAYRFKADAFFLAVERVGFWRSRLRMTRLPVSGSPAEYVIRAHQELERYLRRDFNSAADWLWLHGRWSHHSSPHKRFHLRARRDQMALAQRVLGYGTMPRETRLWVRLPNWLGDVVMALPLLRAIRESRPDMRITLIGKAAFQPLIDRLGVSEEFIPLPPRGRGYFRAFYRLRDQYPDTYLLFTNSFRSDLEAWFTRCPQRFGMVRPQKRRPLLTDAFVLPDSVDETTVHQTQVWVQMMRRYGMSAPLDFAPLPRAGGRKAGMRIGLICGTENSPEKRWPASHWRALIEQILATFPEVEIFLFGTPADDAITRQVGDGFDPARVCNLAGKTDLAAFCDRLADCHAVVCNDTGGMHLANMLGTPVVGVFGPTNPVRTGPIFDAPKAILQPEGCPPTGGAPIDAVQPETVFAAVRPFLESD